MFIEDIKRTSWQADGSFVEHTFSDGCGYVDEKWLTDQCKGTFNVSKATGAQIWFGGVKGVLVAIKNSKLIEIAAQSSGWTKESLANIKVLFSKSMKKFDVKPGIVDLDVIWLCTYSPLYLNK